MIGFNKDGNDPKCGLFGDVDAYCVATEEQGRKTLHGHILLWLSDWKDLWKGLGSAQGTALSSLETRLKAFAKKIMTTRVYGTTDNATLNPCDTACQRAGSGISGMRGISVQSVRELRLESGVTEYGDKSILKCDACRKSYTSEDLAIAFCIKKFGAQNILRDNVKPTLSEFWERNLRHSACGIRMEIFVMTQLLPNRLEEAILRSHWESEEVRLIVNVLRNMHKSFHTRACSSIQAMSAE